MIEKAYIIIGFLSFVILFILSIVHWFNILSWFVIWAHELLSMENYSNYVKCFICLSLRYIFESARTWL